MRTRTSRWMALAVGLAITVGTLAGCGAATDSSGNGLHAVTGDQPVLNWKVANFTAIDQDGKPFGLGDVQGKIWIADFFYTSCPTVCPPVAGNMAHLQKLLADDHLNAEFVSFSVDPSHETPAMLKKFGQVHQADFSNWHLLTGYSDEWIQQYSKSTFKALVSQVPNTDFYNHTVNWYLIDKSGNILSVYSGLQPPYDEIVKAIRALQ